MLFQKCLNHSQSKILSLLKVFNPGWLSKKSLFRGKCLHLSVFYTYFDNPLHFFSILRISRHPVLLFQSAPLNFLMHDFIRQFFNFKYPQNEKENFNYRSHCSFCFFGCLLRHPEKRMQSYARDARLWQSLIFIKKAE